MSRRFLAVAVAAVSWSCLANRALADNGPTLVTAPVDKVFVPFGFDDNDNAEVVIKGEFLSTCYKTGPASAAVDYTTNTVTITAQAYLYAGVCGQIVFPYFQSVKLGPIKKGTYQIVVAGAPKADTTAPLVVAQAITSSPDDYLYAAVEDADLVKNANGNYYVRVDGNWPVTLVGCMVMKEIRVERTPGNVLVVRPIAEFSQGAVCSEQGLSHKFSLFAPVSAALDAGDYLLHIRVLNGNSYNRLVEVGQ